MTGKIEHVTDTAFWVASFRALESERSDALFRDPRGSLGRREGPQHRGGHARQAERTARRELLSRVGASAESALIITEGVIPYLHDDEVARLAEDVHAVAAFRYWIQDYMGVEARRSAPSWRKKMAAAPFVFEAPDWFGFFAKFGFVEAESISVREQARQIGRRPPLFSPLGLPLLLPLPEKAKKQLDRMLGYTLLERRAARA